MSNLDKISTGAVNKMGKSITEKAKRGFQRILEEASCTTSVPGFLYADLKKHPFGYKLPVSPTRENSLSDISFIGHPGERESIQGMIRMIGWTLTHDLLGGMQHNVFFLRIIHAECVHFSDNNHQDIYYEVGIRNRLFMTGGCSHYMGIVDSSEMEDVITFLSMMYGVKVQRHTNLPYQNYETYERQMWRDLDASHQELHQHMERWWAKIQKYRSFKVGDIVSWNPDVSESDVPSSFNSFNKRFKFSRNQTFEIKAIEEIPGRCTCGIGDKSWIVLHPETRCNLRRIHEAVHNQIVTVTVNGKNHKLSGYYFDTHKLFDDE